MAAVPLTREDLHNGPGKEKLPQELQDAERDDTVCKYVRSRATSTWPWVVSFVLFHWERMANTLCPCPDGSYVALHHDRYCGVAYLVFSEIKELEKRLRAAEAKMKESEVWHLCTTGVAVPVPGDVA